MQLFEQSYAYTAATYGDMAAGLYDEYLTLTDTEAVSSFLAGLATGRGGRMLDLGAGTGRLARAMSGRGYEVTAVDASPKMIEILKAADLDRVEVLQADFATTAFPGLYDVAYCVDAFNLVDEQDKQWNLFQRVGNALVEGGMFAVSAMLPPRNQLHLTDIVYTERDDEHVRITHNFKHDPATQILKALVVLEIDGEVRAVVPGNARYAWPDELADMAAAAGMIEVARYDNWNKDPYDDVLTSETGIFVYEKFSSSRT